MIPNIKALVAGLLLLAPGRCLFAQEQPWVSPYPGSTIKHSSVKEYEEYELILGALSEGKFQKTKNMEGKVSLFEYENPGGRSTLEIMRNYEAAIAQAGFQTLYRCSKNECGRGGANTHSVGYFYPSCSNCNARYLAAKLERPTGDVYVALYVTDYSNLTFINVVELKPMQSGMVTAGGQLPAEEEQPPVRQEAVPASQPKPAAARESSGHGSTEIETGIIKGLNTFGFHTRGGAASKANADIIVEGSVQTTPVAGDGSKWKWARTTATISLKDGHAGKTFLRFDASDRQASADFNEAARRSRVEVAQKVSEKISQAITEYFENQ